MNGQRLPERKRDDRPAGEGQGASRMSRAGWARIAVALAIASIVLALPADPAALRAYSDLRAPLEVVALAAAGLALTGSGFRILRVAATLLLALTLFLKLADLGTGSAFQRPFNPYLDVKVIVDGWNLLSGSVGPIQALLVVGAGLLAWCGIAAAFFWSFGGLRRLPGTARKRSLAVAAVLLAAGSAAFAFQARPPVAFDAAPYLGRRALMVRGSMLDLARFETELRNDPLGDALGDAAAKPLFSALTGMDVVLVFIESYGRSALEDPRYSPLVTRRLGGVEREIAKAGLHARSGWLTSPTFGGQSWLAHGTLLSGAWLSDQARYDRTLASERPSLSRLFRSAGWRTAAVMPGITRDWPEAEYFGYDRLLDAGALGYRGKPFDWVTMPDQFTLSAFERLERPPGHPPVMAEIALLSSHLPWAPLPTLIGWDQVGDGTAFSAQVDAGDPPSAVWSDPERVRAQYAASLDYVLETLGSYMSRYGADTLFILVGDHQPTAIISGDAASRDVPMHIVSASEALLRRIDGWNLSPGMIPGPDAARFGMQEVRERMVRAFR